MALQITDQNEFGPGALSLELQVNGKVEHQVCIGEAGPGVPISPQTILLWMSAGKPVTATAIALLHERGRLSLEMPVSGVIPEFAQQGKHAITIRHLLTHTAGLHKVLPAAWELSSNWDETIARICSAALPADFVPGRDAAYDPSASWFVLGEIIGRLADESFESFMHREIFDRCGMRSACFSYRSALAPAELAQYWSAIRGTSRSLAWNSEPATLMPRPGASLRATTADIVRFYQALLDGSLLRPETLRLFTSPARGLLHDRTFGMPMDWGLGFMVKGSPNAPYSFALDASSSAFGHGGQQSSIAFADPERQLVFVAGFTSLPGEAAHNKRMRRLITSIFS